MYSYIAKSVLNDHLGSSNDPCCIQNRVIMNRVIKRLRCKIHVNFIYFDRFAKIKKNKQKIEDFRDQLKSTDQSKHDEEQVNYNKCQQKTCLCVSYQSDTNQAVLSQKMTRGLKFEI